MTSALSTLRFVQGTAIAATFVVACGTNANPAVSSGNVQAANVVDPSREENAEDDIGSTAALIQGVEELWGVSLDGLDCQSTADGLRCKCPDDGYGPFSETLDHRSDGYTAGRGERDWESHLVVNAPNNMLAEAYIYGAQCDFVIFDIQPDTRESLDF